MTDEFDTEGVVDRIFKLLERENLLPQIDPFDVRRLRGEAEFAINQELEQMPDSYEQGREDGYSDGKDAGYAQGYDAAAEKMSELLDEMPESEDVTLMRKLVENLYG